MYRGIFRLGLVLLSALFALPAHAEAPAWIATLFPNTEKMDRLEHRLKRLDATEINVNGRMGGAVTVEFQYPEVDGKEVKGQARIFLPPTLRDSPTQTVPLLHNAGYEIDENGVKGLLAKGYVVTTPHAHPLNPLGRGFNLDRAILHAARRLPFVDPLRVSIQGGSAGGWMTLMLTADAFPLVYSLPDVPPIHWGYNASYIWEQRSDDPVVKQKIPFVQVVSAIAKQALDFYGMPFDSPTYLATSPLAHLETITSPTLVTFSTADVLVPIDQVSSKLIQPWEPKDFPKGYSTAMTSRFPGVAGKRTLLEALPRDRYELFVHPLPDDMPKVRMNGTPPKGLKPIVLSFAKNRVWSVNVINEGGVEPGDGHFKFFLGMDHEPFRAWAEAQGVLADQLTSKKLERLMKRIKGEPWRAFQVRHGGQGEERAGNALDYPEAERADVLIGLTAFAREAGRATHLAKLYAKLPTKLKLLGKSLGDGTPTGVLSALEAELHH